MAAATMEVLSMGAGQLVARQGDDAKRLFVLQRGRVGSRVVPESKRANDAAILESENLTDWAEQGVILGSESVVHGKYLESFVTCDACDLLAVPVACDDFRKQLLTQPKLGMSFLRGLARRLLVSNESMTSAQNASQRLTNELEGFYKDFFKIVTEINKDADGEREIIDALGDAKSSKTFTTGQSLSGEQEESRLELNRVIEEYEMTGKQHKLKRGDALFREGDKGSSLFMVLKGKLECYVEGQRAAEMVEGDMIGEISVLLPDATRSAEVIASENTTVAIIPGAQLPVLLQAQPNMILQIARSLTRKLEANFNTVSKSKDKARTNVTRYLGRDGLNPELDYKNLAEKLNALIEEFDLTELLRPYDQLERGAERIAAAKERYVHWLVADREASAG